MGVERTSKTLRRKWCWRNLGVKNAFTFLIAVAMPWGKVFGDLGSEASHARVLEGVMSSKSVAGYAFDLCKPLP